MPTVMPRRASSRARAAPIPDEAPVTKAIRDSAPSVSFAMAVVPLVVVPHTMARARRSSSSSGVRPTMSHHTSSLSAPSVGAPAGIVPVSPTSRGYGACWRTAPRTGSSIVTRSWRGGEVGVGGDLHGRVGGGHGHVEADTGLLDLGRRERHRPFGHDVVDDVAAGRPVGQGGETGIGGQVGSTHGLAQAAEVGVRTGHHADEAPVGGGVVVEGSRVGQAVALAAAHGAEAVVGGDRPFEDPQNRPVERGVDDGADAVGRGRPGPGPAPGGGGWRRVGTGRPGPPRPRRPR